jgi:hypothetical protein
MWFFCLLYLMNPEREPDTLMEQHLSVLLFQALEECGFLGPILIGA